MFRPDREGDSVARIPPQQRMGDGAPAACAAEDLVRTHLRALPGGPKQVGKFETSRGLRLAVNRGVRFIGVFLERFPGDGAIEGVKLNGRSLGHYSPGVLRSSGIRDDPRLGVAGEAYYVRCENLAALARLLEWYEGQRDEAMGDSSFHDDCFGRRRTSTVSWPVSKSLRL